VNQSPVTVPIEALQQEVHRTFDSYLMMQVLPELELGVPDNWDDGDWHSVVIGLVLNKTAVMIFDDLRLRWMRGKVDDKVIGEAGLKFIHKTKKALMPYLDELKELFAGTASQHITYASKVARLEELNFIHEHAIQELKNNLLEGEYLSADHNRRLAEFVLKVSNTIHKEMGVKKFFEHKVVHQQELEWSHESIAESATQLGVSPEQLTEAILQNKYEDQLAK
jgi:hypothetical protein